MMRMLADGSGVHAGHAHRRAGEQAAGVLETGGERVLAGEEVRALAERQDDQDDDDAAADRRRGRPGPNCNFP